MRTRVTILGLEFSPELQRIGAASRQLFSQIRYKRSQFAASRCTHSTFWELIADKAPHGLTAYLELPRDCANTQTVLMQTADFYIAGKSPFAMLLAALLVLRHGWWLQTTITLDRLDT
jgi:hypothetical protein